MRSRLGAAFLAFIAGGLLAVPTSAQEEKDWGYNKGFFFRTPQFELKISTRTQFRYTFTDFDEGSTQVDRGEFTIPRARLRLDGYAFYPWLKYKVQYDFTGQSYVVAVTPQVERLRGPDLRDLYLDITRKPWTCVRLGQFKVPFGQQELTSSGDQEFVDRSIASLAFATVEGERQIGTMLWGTSFEKKFGYEVGLFNGNSRNNAINDNPGYLYAARIHFDPNGEFKLSESALDNPQTVNYTVGAAYVHNTRDAQAELTRQSAEVFFSLKYKRLFILADGYVRSVEQAAGPEVDSDGYIAQVGVFLIPSKIEIALRYSQVDSDIDLPDTTTTQEQIGFNWYFSKQELKFQTDYGRIEDESTPLNRDTEVFRAQLQIVF
ncbi:MAG: OprO/OprP family phosphate-selective porin [Acidobacteria bacterium]|nr:OprO/OprP family phosphate-selective porin [Acidobacteriota bacterium]